MAEVTGIIENKGITEISLNGARFVRVLSKHFNKCPLNEGDEIEPNAYLEKLSEVQFHDAYEAALSMLDVSAKTSSDVKRALIRKGYAEPAADMTCEKLTSIGLIDDKRYAQLIAESSARKNMGMYTIKRKLTAKGIPTDISEELMSGIDSEQQLSACKETMNKLLRKYEKLPPREKRAKLSQALGRRGFSWDVISETLSGIDD